MSVVGGSYTNFVKENYPKVRNLPAKQRMAKLGQMWRASKQAKGKGIVGGEEGGIFIKRKGGRKMKKVRGKGILSDTLGAFGLGVDPEGGKFGRIGGEMEGKGLITDTLESFGLGVKKRGKKKGKGVAGGDVAGSGIFSGLLGSLGLGMSDKVKQKHFKRMVSLEKQLHSKGKLTPVQHNKLKVYHTLHGQGFFDSLFSGIKKGVGAVASVVPHAISAIPQVLKVLPEAAKVLPSVGQLAAPLAKVAPLAMMMM